MTHLLHLLPIIITGVIAAALIFEKVQRLYFKYSIDGQKFLREIETLILKNNLQGALDLCSSNDQIPLAKIVKSGLLKVTRDETEIKAALEETYLDCTGLIHQRIGYLAMIANVATLLGLLGTIAGLISSFEAVASADAATKQALLASGISTSMNATAAGLIVAIPVMIAYSMLNSRANRITDELEKGATRVLTLLHGRHYNDQLDDFSKVSFDEVQKGAA